MRDFRIVKFLGSIFTPELNITNSLKFLNVVAELLGDKLDGSPVVLPIPQDAPANIPRLQLTSSDNKWTLGMSLERTDLHYQNPSVLDKEIIEIEDFSSISTKFFSEFKRKMDLRVQRLAFITQRISPEKNAAYYIIDKFCKREYYEEKGRPLNNSKRFEIHSLKNYSWEGFRLNSWVRIKSIDYGTTDSIPVLFIENDLNTLSAAEDSEKKFSAEDIEKYFREIPRHINVILGKYFT